MAIKGLVGRTWIGALVLFLFAGVAGAQTTANFDLTNVSGPVLDGVYTSPYYASINGAAPTPVICDDFNDESFIPEDWTANVTALPTIPNSTTSTSSILKFNTAPNYSSLTQLQDYTVAALLATEILANSNNIAAQEDLSFALWDFFDPSQVVAWMTNYNDSSDLTAAQGYVTSAVNQVQGGSVTPAQFSNVTIYSYNGGGTSCGGGYCPPPPQEFIVVTPEPASVVLFGFGLLGIALRIRKKRFAR